MCCHNCDRIFWGVGIIHRHGAQKILCSECEVGALSSDEGFKLQVRVRSWRLGFRFRVLCCEFVGFWVCGLGFRVCRLMV